MLRPSGGPLFSRQSPPPVMVKARCKLWRLAVRCGEPTLGNVQWSVVHAGGKKSVFLPRREKGTKRPFAEGRKEGRKERRRWRSGVTSPPDDLRRPRVATSILLISLFVFFCKSLRFAEVADAFNGFTLYYHATTTRGTPWDMCTASKIHKRRHLKYSSYRPGHTGSIW